MEMPREEEMLPKDKYTVFDRKERRYRKGIHSESFLEEFSVVVMESGYKEARDLGEMETLANLYAEVPKWTRVSQRLNPPGF